MKMVNYIPEYEAMAGEKLFQNDAIMAETVADLARLYYMDSYEEGSNKEKTEAPA